MPGTPHFRMLSTQSGPIPGPSTMVIRCRNAPRFGVSAGATARTGMFFLQSQGDGRLVIRCRRRMAGEKIRLERANAPDGEADPGGCYRGELAYFAAAAAFRTLAINEPTAALAANALTLCSICSVIRLYLRIAWRVLDLSVTGRPRTADPSYHITQRDA